MAEYEAAKQYLVDRFRREPVIAGTPESIAAEGHFPPHEVEEAITELVGEGKVRPFQDDEGTVEYQWGDSCDVE